MDRGRERERKKEGGKNRVREEDSRAVASYCGALCEHIFCAPSRYEKCKKIRAARRLQLNLDTVNFLS